MIRDLADRLTAHRIGPWLFAVTSVVFMLSPIWELSDARYSMLLSESIIRNHSVYMNGYQFPEPIREAERCVPPSPPLQSGFLTYQLDRVGGNVVYCYPNGTSILSIPLVGLMNALGVHCYSQDGRYLPLGEGFMQRVLAALLMACLLYTSVNLLSSLTTILTSALVYSTRPPESVCGTVTK